MEERQSLRSWLTGDYEGIGHCIIGYPEGDLPAKKPRKENYVYWVE